MILQELHTAINAVINAYPITADIEATAPFAAYTADHVTLKDKTGVCGYEYTVRIAVVDDSIANCITQSASIKSAVESLEGATGLSTVFDAIFLQSESQRLEDESGLYINEIEYRVLTTNV
jgi:hypothetical protein